MLGHYIEKQRKSFNGGSRIPKGRHTKYLVQLDENVFILEKKLECLEQQSPCMSIAMSRFVSIASNERRTFLILTSHSENVILKFLNGEWRSVFGSCI